MEFSKGVDMSVIFPCYCYRFQHQDSTLGNKKKNHIIGHSAMSKTTIQGHHRLKRKLGQEEVKVQMTIVQGHHKMTRKVGREFKVPLGQGHSNKVSKIHYPKQLQVLRFQGHITRLQGRLSRVQGHRQ